MREKLRRAAPLLVAAAAFSVFLPSLRNGWLNWDDDGNFLNNPYFRGLGPSQLRWMFTTTGAHYCPLPWLTYGLDWTLWGLNPAGYHLTGVLIHAGAAAVFYLAALRLLQGEVLGAAFAALFFAVHPLRVESVAWVSERSGLMAGFFCLLTVHLHILGRRRAALTAFIASLLCKPIGLALPFALAALDLKKARGLLPFLLASAAAAAISLSIHAKPGYSWSAEQLPPLLRLPQAFYGLAFYLRQTLVPAHLLPLYMMPIRYYPFSPPFLLSALLAGLITWLALRRPPWLAAWLFYVLLLLPVLGFVKSGPQLVADRYSYVSCSPWAVLAGAAIAKDRRLAVPAGVAVLALAALTWRQQGVWKDPESFWSYQVDNDPTNSIARDLLGDLRASQGRREDAARLYREALAINPNYAAAHNGLGNVMAGEGRFKEAEAYYLEARRLSPGEPVIEENLRAAQRLERSKAR